jgi:hypothetical protein
MADLWQDADEITNATGIVFGLEGTPVLDVALDRASNGGRRVLVIAAANPAALAPHKGKGLRVAQVDSSKRLNEIAAALSGKNEFDAIVLYGLSAYANIVFNEIVGKAAAERREWGEVARAVANDVIRLSGLAPAFYATCDVVDAEREVKQGDKTVKEVYRRLSINPGLSKLILDHLYEKVYVSVNRLSGAVEIQDNSALALQFVAAKAQKTEQSATEKPLGHSLTAQGAKERQDASRARTDLGNGGNRRIR